MMMTATWWCVGGVGSVAVVVPRVLECQSVECKRHSWYPQWRQKPRKQRQCRVSPWWMNSLDGCLFVCLFTEISINEIWMVAGSWCKRRFRHFGFRGEVRHRPTYDGKTVRMAVNSITSNKMSPGHRLASSSNRCEFLTMADCFRHSQSAKSFDQTHTSSSPSLLVPRSVKT